MYVCIYIYIYVCIYVYMYMYIYMYQRCKLYSHRIYYFQVRHSTAVNHSLRYAYLNTMITYISKALYTQYTDLDMYLYMHIYIYI